MSTTPAAVAPRNETVFVVDDDEAMRDSLTWLLEGNGYTVRTYRRRIPGRRQARRRRRLPDP
jgi:DNA-binding NtrC family response regulator